MSGARKFWGLCLLGVLSTCFVAISLPAQATPDQPVTRVLAFDNTPIYFTGNDNQRDVLAPSNFPAGGSFSKITMHISLACPTGGCDPWDRYGTIGVVIPSTDVQFGDSQPPPTIIELARFMTPYGVGASWSTDVTNLRPILRGTVTLAAHIDTWVGPGNASGAGWQLTTWFTMKPGKPIRESVAVIPVWSPREVRYGDPVVPTAVDAPAVALAVPAGGSFALRTLVTGHGQGNKNDCSEFCSTTQTIRVSGESHQLDLWRKDCATSGAYGQLGNYWYSRAGWCPGDLVKPWVIELGQRISKTITKFSYGVTPYVNTCRPGATPPVPTTCTLGTSPEYDGGRHTEPIYRLSTVLIVYRQGR